MYMQATPISLTNASGEKIKVHGQVNLDVVLSSLRRVFPWTFIVADVVSPLLGYDFLKQYHLLVDCSANVLRDSETHQQANLIVSSSIMNVSVETPNIPAVVKDILDKYPNLTSPNCRKKPPSTQFYHRIDTGSSPPVFSKYRRLNEQKLATAKQAFQKMLNDGIISQSNSPWSSPLHQVKKANGEFRQVGDFRDLNRITIPDRYPIPNMNDVSAKLHGKQKFSKIDLVQAFHQIPVHPDDVNKTAITTPFGLFNYNFMPFGLRNASNTFQRYMDHIFRDIPCVFTYIDDILIFSDNEQDHLNDLKTVFSLLDDNNLKISLHKCNFNVDEIEFLGYNVTSQGVTPPNHKKEQLKSFPCPNDTDSLRRFLGLVGFYRKMIPKFAEIVFPLSELLRLNPKSKCITLSSTEREAFDSVVEALCNAQPLSHPNSKNTYYQLVTDSSNYAVGAALHEMNNGNSIPIGFYSKKLNEAQRKYSTFDRELLAAYLSVLHFKHQIEGRVTILCTDHKPLCNAFNNRTTSKSDRQQRYLSLLSEYISDIHFIKGSDNIVADCLSRPCNNVTLDLCDLPAIAEGQTDDAEMSKYTDKLKEYKINSDIKLFCNVDLPNPRPYVPLNLRKSVFDCFHNLAHSGVKASKKLIKNRYFWPSMDRDIAMWCRECMNCQEAKVNRHTKSPAQSFSLPSPRFQTVHIDIVGPLPTVKSLNSPDNSPYKYILTMIDRATRWIEATPLIEITASSVARAFVESWLSRFGVPLHLITDRGSQFESELFTELSAITGFHRLRTTSYHPQTNGLVERMHRTLKAAIVARKENWLSALPIVLLGLRCIPNDSNYSPFTAMTGSTILLPKLIIADNNVELSSHSEIQELVKEMSYLDLENLCDGNIHSKKSSPYIPKDLKSCDYIWLRTDRVRKALEAPYTAWSL